MAERFRYTFQIKWTSLLGVLSFGILVPTFFIPLELGSRAHYLSILVATLTSYIIWEGSKLIQAIVLYFFPWEKSIIKHLVYEITYIFVFSSLMLIIGILIYSHIVSSMDISVAVILRNIFVSFVLTLLFIAINEGAFLFSKWKESLIEQEKLRQENLIAKVENLKRQLDPHFLFNSLSVLSGVVYKDPVLADRFISKLSQVYRYVLEHNEQSLVHLDKEISMVEAFCFLLNVRFLNKITLQVNVTKQQVAVLPMSIQLLVENAVKHNRISESQPLELRIYDVDDHIWVENTLNVKGTSEHSMGIGLKNLEARYRYITSRNIVVEKTETLYRVGLPLISIQYEDSNNRG